MEKTVCDLQSLREGDTPHMQGHTVRGHTVRGHTGKHWGC